MPRIRSFPVTTVAMLWLAACASAPVEKQSDSSPISTPTGTTGADDERGTSGGAPDAGNGASGTGNESDGATPAGPDAGDESAQNDASIPEVDAPGLNLNSKVIEEGGEYPQKYSCNGDDVLPPLAWGEPPEGTKSFVLTFTDLDADLNDGRFVHWALFDIGADVRELPEDIGTAANPQVPAGATQVRGWSSLCGTVGGSNFLGPCPSEQHTYEFKLYALSVPKLDGASCNLQPIQVDDLVVQSGTVLSETTLRSIYTPPP